MFNGKYAYTISYRLSVKKRELIGKLNLWIAIAVIIKRLITIVIIEIKRNLEDLDFDHRSSTEGGRILGWSPFSSEEKGVTVAVQFYCQGDFIPGPFEHLSGSVRPNGLNLWGPNAFYVPAPGPPPGPAPQHQAPHTPGHPQGPVAGVTQNGTVYYHQPTVYLCEIIEHLIFFK